MPELPEVETISRNVRPRLVGRRIVAFESKWKKSVSPSFAAVRRALAGRRVVDVLRRAKFIVWRFDDDAWLLIHLRMSGRLEFAADHTANPKHVRSAWSLDDGERLLFEDARKFGRITYTRDLAAATADLGVEPLSRQFTTARLTRLLNGRQRQLKPLLLDQSVIAGLGNIYADEALHRARLHPLTVSDALTAQQIAALRRAIRHVLNEAVRNHGTSIDWIYPNGWMQNRLRVYGRAGEPCRTCRTPIERLVVGQRGTHVCPRCQRVQ